MAGVTANYPVSEASTAAFRWVVPRGFMELESCGNQKRMYSAGQPQLARFRFFRLVKRKQISRSNFLLKSTCLGEIKRKQILTIAVFLGVSASILPFPAAINLEMIRCSTGVPSVFEELQYADEKAMTDGI